MINKLKVEALGWVVAGLFCVGLAWPAEYWYNPGHMRVLDTYEGERIQLIYAGGTQRDFLGAYSVVLRDVSTSSIVGEMGSTRINYKATSVRPDPLYMDWWAPSDERISSPEVGAYLLETCWTIYGTFFGLVPAKTTCITSNIFEIMEKKEDDQQAEDL